MAMLDFHSGLIEVGKYRKPKTPGRCFVAAGYKLRVRKNGKPHTSTNGLWLYVKRNL